MGRRIPFFPRVLFFPSKFPNGDWNPEELAFEDVWITSSGGTRIHGWYCPSDNPRAYLLYMHGNAGNITHRTDLLVRLQRQLQVTVLIFDYRGYGRSEGRSTIFTVTKDAKAAAKFLANKVQVAETELLFMGRSLGGAVAIELSAKLQPRGLIVESAFSSLSQIAAHHYSILSWLVPGWILNSKSSIRKYAGSLLMSHSKNDLTIPYEHGVQIFDSANEPKSFTAIQDASHNDPMPRSYFNSLDQFIADLDLECGK